MHFSAPLCSSSPVTSLPRLWSWLSDVSQELTQPATEVLQTQLQSSPVCRLRQIGTALPQSMFTCLPCCVCIQGRWPHDLLMQYCQLYTEALVRSQVHCSILEFTYPYLIFLVALEFEVMLNLRLVKQCRNYSSIFLIIISHCLHTTCART